MNARIVAVLMLGASGVGFAVGYGWPRDPAEDPATKQLIALTDKIATDVSGIQRALASDAAQRAGESAGAARVKSESVPSQQSGADASRSSNDVAAAYAAAQASEQAGGIVSRGISSGRWTDSDVQELRSAMNGLSSAQKQAIVAPLLQAINAQQIKLEVEQGGAL